MGLFTKSEYKELLLPFKYVESDEDFEAGIISLEAFGNVFGEEKYCFASYDLSKHIMYDNGDYEQMIQLLKNTEGKSVNVIFKFKNGKYKNFKFDLDSLAQVCNDERFKSMDMLGWGLNDKSFAELESEYSYRRGDKNADC